MPSNFEPLAILTWQGVGGDLVLGPDYRFRARPAGDEVSRAFLSMMEANANLAAIDYSYSPGHGRPGGVLAYGVAKNLGAEVELPGPEPEPGLVY